MLKAKINENGVFEINRGGVMQAMICPFGSGNCGAHCPFFTDGSGLSGVSTEYGRYDNYIILTCMEKERKFRYAEDEFIDERK